MDLYSLLGLTRGATVAEIDRAYRRLARRYHPGINPGDRVAEEMYRQIQSAHQVLADAERRRHYDRDGASAAPDVEPESAPLAFEGFDFSTPAEGPLAATFSELFADVFQDAARAAVAPARGTDLEITLSVSFIDAARGAQVPCALTRHERCPQCSGEGRVSRAPLICPACRGEGARRWARGHMVFTKSCETCDGTGRVAAESCRACAGSGLVPRTEALTLALPPGLDSGSRLAVPGLGHASPRGFPSGDLYVTVEVADHPVFKRVGRDVFVTVPLALHEAALGAEIDVPTLEGRARLSVPAGTPPGHALRLRGHGLPAPGEAGNEAGDLVVQIAIAMPLDLDDDSRALLRAFGERNPADVRAHLFVSA